MLAVPLKETKGVDWSGPLRTYISTNYSPEELDKHASSVQRLSTTRERVANASGASDSSVEAMESYLRMLGEVEPRFPLGEGGLKLSFTWFDALKPQKKLSMTAVEFERACVLYNLGAVLSHQGMVQDRSDIGGLKKACAFFQRAAGIFAHLRDNVVGHRLTGPTLTDMSPEGLEMVVNLMLAQAQACFYEKAIRDELKPALLSKLSAQAREWYGQAVEASRAGVLASTLDPAWAVHLEFQYRCFSASTEFQYCKVVHQKAEETTEGYGEEIARLGLASELCEAAIHTAREGRLPASMLETVQHLRRVIHTRMDEASEANNRIYMQMIPPTKSLSRPPGAALAKPLAPDAALTDVGDIAATVHRGSDAHEEAVFAGLLPVVMQEAEALYTSRLSHMVEDYGKKVQDAAEEVKLRLAEAGLPAAVEAGDGSSAGLPDAVWTRMQASVVSRGGVAGLRAGIEDNGALAAKVGQALREIEQALNEEERDDSRCRSTWGDSWSITASAELSLHMRGDITRYRSLVAEARQSDGELQSKLTSSSEKLVILGYPKSQLDAMMPTADEIDNNPDVESTRAELAVMLVTLGATIQECENLQGQLVDETSADSIAVAMARAPGGASAIAASEQKVQNLIQQEVAKYRPTLTEMDKHIRDLPMLLSRVLDRNHAFSRMRNTSTAMVKREGVIAEIDAAIQTYDELATYIGEGEKFYQNLAGRIEQLRVTAMDHCYVREMQRKELEADLAARFGGDGGAGGATTAAVAAPGGAYPGMMSRPGFDRQQSQPLMTPYAAGPTAAQAFPIGPDAVQTVPSVAPAYPTSVAAAPPPAYSAATNGDESRAAKLHKMRSTLGTSIPDADLEQALDGAGGNVNRAINHVLGAEPEAPASTSSKRGSKKRFGIF